MFALPRSATRRTALLLVASLSLSFGTTSTMAHASAPLKVRTIATATTSGSGILSAISCVTGTDCVAVGQDQVLAQPMVVTKHAGAWSAATDQPAPTTPGAAHAGQGAYLSLIHILTLPTIYSV